MKRRGARSAERGAAVLAAALCLSRLAGGAAGAQVWEVDNRLLTAATPAEGENVGAALAVGDFDGDGRDDLAAGVPSAQTGPNAGEGRVDLYLGRLQRGFTLPISLSAIAGGDCQQGAAVVAGNFDASPQDELVFGAPGCAGGRVIVVYFGAAISYQTISQSEVAADPAEAGDDFGAALAVGDFDADGFDDLAIGAPGEDLGRLTDNGVLHVLYGSAAALTVAGAQTFAANSFVANVATSGDRFAVALASGDFDADGFSDLAIGAPGRGVAAAPEAGEIHLAYGSGGGLAVAGNQRFDDSSFGFAAEPFDHFGAVLAAGNFDARGGISCFQPDDDCAQDLAIGVPDEDAGDTADSGHLIVAFGRGAAGLGVSGAQSLDQATLGYSIEAGDRFAEVLVAGRLDSSDFFDAGRWATDLVVGVPHESFLTAQDGVAHLLFGSPAGFVSSATQLQAAFDGYLAAPPVGFDRFADALAIGDFDGDGQGDLAAGAPGRPAAGLPHAGAVQVLYGAAFADGFGSATVDNWSGGRTP